MKVSGKVQHSIINGPPDLAKQLLATVLSDSEQDMSCWGQLAGRLFLNAKHDLAAMIFARWVEIDANNPEPWGNLGLCMLKMQKTENARELLEYALELEPAYFPAWCNLVDVYKELGELDKQLACARECVRLQPNSSLAHNNLGTSLQEAGRLEEAYGEYQISLSIDPDNFEARFNLARISAEQGNHSDATKFFEAALSAEGKGQPHREVIEYHLAYEYLATGKLSEGWKLYEKGFSPKVPLSIARRPARSFEVPMWNGLPLQDGETLMVWREQGIGDELRFLSLLPLINLGKGRLIIETEPRLVEILKRSFPSALVRPQKMENPAGGMQSAFDYDCHLPIGSLPRLLMNHSSIYPSLGGYIQPSLLKVEEFANRMKQYEGKAKVGICWRSHKLSPKRNAKYTRLGDWTEVLTIPDIVFVNLQYGDCESEITEIEGRLGIDILRWKDVNLMDDLESVIGIMGNLDLVIAPSTAVIPIAGALGVKSVYIGHQNWMMLGESEIYPWFRSVTPVLASHGTPVSSVMADVRRKLELVV